MTPDVEQSAILAADGTDVIVDPAMAVHLSVLQAGIVIVDPAMAVHLSVLQAGIALASSGFGVPAMPPSPHRDLSPLAPPGHI